MLPATGRKESFMNGYDSYLTSLPPKPPYTRIVEYAGQKPLYDILRDMGALIETENRETKIVCNTDTWARSYRTAVGGVIEVRREGYDDIIIFIAPEDMQAYKQYVVPMPFWVYITG